MFGSHRSNGYLMVLGAVNLVWLLSALGDTEYAYGTPFFMFRLMWVGLGARAAYRHLTERGESPTLMPATASGFVAGTPGAAPNPYVAGAPLVATQHSGPFVPTYPAGQMTASPHVHAPQAPYDAHPAAPHTHASPAPWAATGSGIPQHQPYAPPVAPGHQPYPAPVTPAHHQPYAPPTGLGHQPYAPPATQPQVPAPGAYHQPYAETPSAAAAPPAPASHALPLPPSPVAPAGQRAGSVPPPGA